MSLSYQHITPALVHQTKLLMTDVDGTLTSKDDTISPAVFEVVHHLEKLGIIVGLVSGRTLSGLESLAHRLNISGPIIAENGAIAKLEVDSELIESGYSRKSSKEALKKLQLLYPGSIRGREDNAERLVDAVFRTDGVPREVLIQHLEDCQILDSGYIMHLMPAGISKGHTLFELLGSVGHDGVSPEEVIVFGDSATDLSLFELFPHSVLIPNPGLAPELTDDVQRAATYIAGIPFGEGFVQVAQHIADIRASSGCD
jgi:hydroxymethylpyrimidine pyrophosphatase-like HAD family hydrolase